MPDRSAVCRHAWIPPGEKVVAELLCLVCHGIVQGERAGVAPEPVEAGGADRCACAGELEDPACRYAELAGLVHIALPSRPLTVVASVGTGASSAGLIQPLRQHDPSARLVGVQPFGSVSFGSERFQDPEAIIAGIGSAIPFDNIRPDLYDQLHWLTFRYAMAGTIDLMRTHAVFAGLSTGAAFLVAAWEAQRHPEREHLVIGADTGHRYVDKVFARHEEALAPAPLRPTEIGTLKDLAPPWSTMDWERRTYPDHARPSVPASRPSPETCRAPGS
ncbi:cysteine synthase [Micromonospora sp. ATCC 39149]|nr:cysteine synthase [Micromonospora sp. ATCC 39149]